MNIQTKDTNTTMFLVPGLGLKVTDLRKKGFINAYLEDESTEPIDGCVLLLFKTDDLSKFQEFVKTEYIRTEALIDDYDHDGNFVVLVYQFPNEWEPEFKNFKKGHYSKFRQKYVSLIPQISVSIVEGKMVNQSSIPFMACKQARALREYWEDRIGDRLDDDAECWPKPNMKKETLDIQKIRDEYNTGTRKSGTETSGSSASVQ